MTLGVETAGTQPVQQLSNNAIGVTMGQSTTDLISFYNAPPVAQQANTIDAIQQLITLGLLAAGSASKSQATPVVLAAATTTTPAANARRTNILNAAAGFAVTMPAATGTGNVYEFYVGTTVTTGTMTMVSQGTDAIYGDAFQVSGASTACFNIGGAASTVSFNGSTKGGFQGDKVTWTDVSTGVWGIQVISKVTGAAATPFS